MNESGGQAKAPAAAKAKALAAATGPAPPTRDPTTPSPKVSAPSPESSEKTARPVVSFREQELVPGKSSPTKLPPSLPPPGILKATAVEETQTLRDTQVSLDPSRADTLEWDGVPKPVQLWERGKSGVSELRRHDQVAWWPKPAGLALH